MSIFNLPTGGYAAENDRVQQDVMKAARQLLADKGDTSKVKEDLDAFHTAYQADGGLAKDTRSADMELQQAPGLSDADKNTLASILAEDPEAG